MSTQTDLTVRKTVTVPLSQADAFELFTEGLATWWPFETHSVGDEPETVVFEPRVGGRVYDRVAGGTENEWATVTAWEPPERLAVDWHVTAGKASTDLEVRFVPDGGGTRVELTHGGWERWADEAGAQFDSYNGGWDTVLGRFVQKAGGS